MESKEELRKRLTPIQYQVTQEAGTERPFTGKYNKCYDKGVYQCIVCREDLFTSDTKYDSGCGWPAFNDVLEQGKVTLHRDASIAGNITISNWCFIPPPHWGHFAIVHKLFVVFFDDSNINARIWQEYSFDARSRVIWAIFQWFLMVSLFACIVFFIQNHYSHYNCYCCRFVGFVQLREWIRLHSRCKLTIITLIVLLILHEYDIWIITLTPNNCDFHQSIRIILTFNEHQVDEVNMFRIYEKFCN